MNLLDALRNRRSIKKFTSRPMTRADIEPLLDAAVLAPNHRMTEPWGFLVLGEGARRSYGQVLGGRRAQRVEDPEAAAAVREKSIREMVSVPAIVAVTTRLDENPEIREEDYAATFMAIQNFVLAATARGFGTHIKTGAVMADPALRAALGVEEGQRIVALIFLGEPEEVPAPKNRTPAAEKTVWLP